MLMQDFNVSFNNADTIVRTEMAHIQTQAAIQRYKDYGITEVEILADKDERQCEVCGKLHKKRYPTGANVPIPAHPRCRCSVIPVVEMAKTPLKIDIQLFAENSERYMLTSNNDNDNIKIPKDMFNQNEKQLRKGIRHHQEKIKLHYEYLDNPKLKWKDWDNFSDARKERELRHWRKEIVNFKNNIKAANVLIKKKGGK